MSFMAEHMERAMLKAEPSDVVFAARDAAVDWLIRGGYLEARWRELIPHFDVMFMPEDWPWPERGVEG